MKVKYEELLQQVDEELEYLIFRQTMLKKYSHYHKYFAKLSARNRGRSNMYVVDLKRVVLKKLFKEGMPRADIGAILNLDHATIIHSLRMLGETTDTYKTAEENYEQWIQDEVFPFGTSKTIKNEGPTAKKQRFRTILTYKLIKL